ncbi:HpcH/HpaI aldolase/citrate lyase family protein [Sphingomonas mesophila]|uniref:HpcH/HpaI aldolase/citrate lyase family protein n=1 Tax=Sphingomonas mesophila TaxID=2303576 RepID=UPI000E56A49A|nr:CoA ester lyase [Sphingomonas mesophila]
MRLDLFGRPALLFLPASRASAISRARTSGADVVILDLEDAVRPEDKETARSAAVAAAGEDWLMPVGIRVNLLGSGGALPEDVAAVAESRADFIVLPKADGGIGELARASGKPVVAMVETPAGVLALREMVRDSGIAGLIAGTNDLAAELGLPVGAGREPLQMALQSIVLAARAGGMPAWDGVFNRLDDAVGLEAEARSGRTLGFDGKSLIHPDQIAPCKAAFAPSPEEIARAERLVAAARGGAQRFEEQMIEAMHVEAARRVLDRR